uniref:RAB7B, member RAS onco family n=2 Tax=Corvus TaxID=30420 RepID=A0A8U7NJS0_CORMO
MEGLEMLLIPTLLRGIPAPPQLPNPRVPSRVVGAKSGMAPGMLPTAPPAFCSHPSKIAHRRRRKGVPGRWQKGTGGNLSQRRSQKSIPNSSRRGEPCSPPPIGPEPGTLGRAPESMENPWTSQPPPAAPPAPAGSRPLSADVTERGPQPPSPRGQGSAALSRILLSRLSPPRPGGSGAGSLGCPAAPAGPVHGCQQEGGSEDHHHRSSGIWDTGGQERFRSMVSTFYKGSDGCVLAFDVTDRESFEALDNWRDDFLEKVISREQDFPMVVLGNKIDLCDRQVPEETASAWCKEKDIPYFEVSAKNNINVAEAFETLAKQALSRYKGIFESYLTDSIKLTPNDKPKKSCC